MQASKALPTITLSFQIALHSNTRGTGRDQNSTFAMAKDDNEKESRRVCLAYSCIDNEPFIVKCLKYIGMAAERTRVLIARSLMVLEPKMYLEDVSL